VTYDMYYLYINT